MRKTLITCILDFVRFLAEIAGTFLLFYLTWTMFHWLAAVILVIPVYLAVSGFVNFLALPLYLLTPEHRVTSEVLSAIQKGDFSTALTTLEVHEKWHAAKQRVSSYKVAAETDIPDNSLANIAGAA